MIRFRNVILILTTLSWLARGDFLTLKSWAIPLQQQSSSNVLSISGRDTWLPAGTSRILRLVGTEDLVSPGATPNLTFTPGPIQVNYVTVGTARDLTASITVAPGVTPGFQSLEVTDGTITHNLANALRIVDATILNLSPSVLPLGGSAVLSIAPHSLFSGQTSFSLDLGPDLSVGPITLEPDGSLQAPVSVINSAIPGTRSVHVTAGPYALLAERGFAIDFGPLLNSVHLFSPGGDVPDMTLGLPAGYTASVSASSTLENGITYPDEMYVDATNTLYVASQLGGTCPFSVSVFDLNPSNFGALKAIFTCTDIDPSGLDQGVLEKLTMLPSQPGKLFVASEDLPPYNGGHTIYKIDIAIGNSSVFLFNSDWNFDAIETDKNGNLVVPHSVTSTGAVEASVLDSNANIIKTCSPYNQDRELFLLDPLDGKFIAGNYGRSWTFNFDDCTSAPRSDGPSMDEGSFAPGGGNFGNQFFVAVPSNLDVLTLVPVSYTDPDQSVPQRVVAFATGFPVADSVVFDRDGENMMVTDHSARAVIAISRIPGYQPDAPVVSLSPIDPTFGPQPVGTTSPPLAITLTNTGTASLTIAGITPSGDFAQSNTCGNAVSAGQSCTLSITFTPTGPNTRSGSITITHSGSATPHVVTLAGTGVGPGVTLSAAALTFETLLAGKTSTPQTVTLSNSGNATLNISNIAASGDYSQTNTCGSTVAPRSSCAIIVTFKPTGPGTRSGMLTISDDAVGAPHVMTLTGTGLAPAVSLSSGSLDFGNQAVNTGSQAQTVTLTNSGNLTLTVNKITASQDYSEMDNCSAGLPPRTNCTINVTFTPTTAGKKTGTLIIADSSADSPQTVALSGNGVDFSISPLLKSLTSATVMAGQAASYALSLKPVSGFAGQVALSCSGAPRGATCVVSPTSAKLDGTFPVAVSVTVATGLRSFTSPLLRPIPPAGGGERLPPWMTLLMIIVVLAGLVGRGESQRRRAGLILAGSILIISVWAACGGGGTGTPPGTYPLTLKGTSGALDHSITLTLTVN